MEPDHSVPLNVHRWSDHPEINSLVDYVWDKLGTERQTSLIGTSNNKGTPPKRILKVLLIDLYSNWLDDPSLCIGVSRNNNSFKPNSRYNALHIPYKINTIIDHLVELDFLHFRNGSYDRTNDGRHSRTSRIRATIKLENAFEKCLANQFDISSHYAEETVTLNEFDLDLEGNPIKKKGGGKKVKKVSYEDNWSTIKMREEVTKYNDLLSKFYIDIGNLEQPFVERRKEKGKPQRVPVTQQNKFVRRIFSRKNWRMNGRWYGGFWQQIGAEYRQHILIEDEPVIEVDYSGLHPSLLAAEEGEGFRGYQINDQILPALNLEQQRKAIKLLVLTAINAKSRAEAFRAFNSSSKLYLKDKELEELLEAFISVNPFLRDHLFSDKGIRLMYVDSEITRYIINEFVKMDIPILSVHDSYLIQHKQIINLKNIMNEATKAVVGKQLKFAQDFYSPIEANLFKHQDYDYFTSMLVAPPAHTVISKRYKKTYKEFKKWKKTSSH